MGTARWPAVLGGLAATAFVVLALVAHPIEVPGGESDLYVDKAEQILRGELPRDIWHPIYYPGLMAGGALLTGDAFTAGKLLSALAGGLLVFATAVLAGSVFGTTAAVLCGLLLAAHGAVVVMSAQAASDVIALAFAMAAFAVSARAVDRPCARNWLGAGVLAGLALGTRFQMLPLVPALLLVAFAAAPRLRRGAFVLAGLALGYLPQALAAWWAYGSPVYSEHWRNIDLKVVHDYDAVAAFADAPASSLSDLLLQHGGRVAGALVRDLGGQLTGGLGEFVASRPCFPADLAIVIAIVLGCLRAWRHPVLRGVVVFGGLYLPMLCVALVPEGRYLLPMLPMAALAMAALAQGGATRTQRLWLCLPLVATIAVAAASMPGWVRTFVDSHPTAEIEAVRSLRTRLTDGDPIASPFSPMMRHVPGHVLWIPTQRLDAQGPALLDQIEQRAQHLHFEYLVVGPASARHLHAALRQCRGITDRACSVESWTEGAAVVRCRPPAGPVRRTRVEVADDGAGSRFVVELDESAPESGRVLAGALRVLGPGGEELSLLLQRQAAHVLAVETRGALASGRWQIEPALVLDDGALRSGARVSFSIGADGRLER